MNSWTRAITRPGSSFPVQILTAEARAYKDAVGDMVKAMGLRPLVGPVYVELGIFRPRAQGDIDGIQKILFDTLKGLAFGDDAFIVGMHVDRFQEVELGRVQLEARECALVHSDLWPMREEQQVAFDRAQSAFLDARFKARARRNAKTEAKKTNPKQLRISPSVFR